MHPDKLVTFLQCVVIFLLLTNAISILVAFAVIKLAQFDRRKITPRWFGEVGRTGL